MVDPAQATREDGIEPIPPSGREPGLLDTFVPWANLGVSFLVMVVGMFLVPGLGLGQALVAILVGALIGNGLLGLIATIGSDTGMPTMVLLRPVLGLRGSYVPSVLNVLQLIGWATFEVIIMAQAAHLLSERFIGSSSYLVWVVFFGAVTTLMAVGGPVLVVKQWDATGTRVGSTGRRWPCGCWASCSICSSPACRSWDCQDGRHGLAPCSPAFSLG
jgi:nucleobase:cation symporter-1, NCS1 family